ncbi:MAG: hypothetical protein DIU68_019755, partial [Chloroflexota bacterium]
DCVESTAMIRDSAALWRMMRAFKNLHRVRAENTMTRDLEFSAWLREHGRPSKRNFTVDAIELGAFVAFDVDWLLLDYERRIVRLLEVKTRGAKMRFAQQSAFKLLDDICRAGAPLVGAHYLGLSVLRLENTTPSNSAWCEWDGERITAEECWRRVNLLDAVEYAS